MRAGRHEGFALLGLLGVAAALSALLIPLMPGAAEAWRSAHADADARHAAVAARWGLWVAVQEQAPVDSARDALLLAKDATAEEQAWVESAASPQFVAAPEPVCDAHQAHLRTQHRSVDDGADYLQVVAVGYGCAHVRHALALELPLE